MATDTLRNGSGAPGGGEDPLLGNKIAAGILVPLLFATGLNVVSGFVYTPKKPAVSGYDLPQPVPAEGAGGGDQATQADPLPVRLASADAAKGQGAAKKCLACHIFDKGGPNKIGPNLWGVVGRAKGSHEGFGYSGAMKGKGGEWSYEDLDGFLANPKGYVPGTIMAFAGVGNPKERADILAFLKTQSDKPVPFPEASTQPASGPAGGAPPAEATKTQGSAGAPQPVAPRPATPQPADSGTQTQPTSQNQPQPPATGANPGGAPSQPTGAGAPTAAPNQAPTAAQPGAPPGSTTPAHQ